MSKGGATLLLRNPADHLSQIGVTVNPVKIASLSEFGSLHEIGEKLLAAEAKKDSTVPGGVTLISEVGRCKFKRVDSHDEGAWFQRLNLNTITCIRTLLSVSICASAARASARARRAAPHSMNTTTAWSLHMVGRVLRTIIRPTLNIFLLLRAYEHV